MNRLGFLWIVALGTVWWMSACGGDDEGTSGGTGGTGGSGAMGGAGGSGGTIEAPPLGCDPLTPTYCGFPYPNDYWTVPDSSTVTGLRLALPDEVMPQNEDGVRSNPDAFNEMDGFSPGIAAMTHFPGATVEGLPTPDTIDDYLLTDCPTVLLNTETGERLAHWVDLDEYVVEAKIRVDDPSKDKPDFNIDRPLAELRQEQALMLRPAIRPEDATRYIVAIRNVRDSEGSLVEASPGFAALRDGTPSGDEVIESRRAHFEEIFATLENAGISRDDLQVAWDFTTASRENNTRAMVHIRDDAFDKYPDGVSYSVKLNNDGINPGIACRLDITFDMPLYMTQGEAGGLLNLGTDGLPEQNETPPTFQYTAIMIVPDSSSPETPSPLVEFGHGQLGTQIQVLGDDFQQLVATENLAAFALDWKGFASDDVPIIFAAISGGDLSDFRSIPERMHQGFLNFLMAMRTLSREAGGDTPLNQALAADCGGAMLDGSKRYYFGGSQGGILGASIMALTQDIERGLLAVPGQSYNLLLNRSVNFDDFAPLFYGKYGWNALDTQMNLALIQGLWDRAEPTGYSKYIRTNRLPNTPAHEVLIQVSKGDHQVTNLGAHIMARTIGGVVNLASDDDVNNVIRPVWDIDVVSGPHEGSSMIEIDFGNPEAPLINIPQWDDMLPDPHGRATELNGIGTTLLDFYETGIAENPCTGPCNEDDLAP